MQEEEEEEEDMLLLKTTGESLCLKREQNLGYNLPESGPDSIRGCPRPPRHDAQSLLFCKDLHRRSRRYISHDALTHGHFKQRGKKKDRCLKASLTPTYLKAHINFPESIKS